MFLKYTLKFAIFCQRFDFKQYIIIIAFNILSSPCNQSSKNT